MHFVITWLEFSVQKILNKVEKREWMIMENNGQKIFGVLHRPLLVENPPVVVILHGFASSKHGSNRCYVTFAENLSKAGIATFRFDFRGSGDSEGALSEITFEDLICDSITILTNLNQINEIDSNRVALFGASLGGSIAILTAARIKKIKTLVLWAPVASGKLWFRDFLMRFPEHANTEPEKILSSYAGIKLHPQFREQFGNMIAYETIQQLYPLPILHMHGEKDKTISIAHQEAFRVASIQSNIHFSKYPDSEHALGYSPSFPNIVTESIEWFRRYL